MPSRLGRGRGKPPLGKRPNRSPRSYWRRHLRSLLRYGTARKWANLARAYGHYLRGSARISTLPCFLKVEISRKCSVHCRYCYSKKEELFYPFDRYRKLIDGLKDYLLNVSLYEVGEPLENERVLEYIRYAHASRIGTVVSSSLSLARPAAFWRDLVCSGLDRLIVAIDGISQPVYQQYRTCGNLRLALANLHRLLRYRDECGSNMIVEWQMLDLPWNACEQAAAGELAKRMGCDEFRLIPEAVLPRQRYEREGVIRQRNCLLPYLVFIVNAYNQVQPCYKPDCRTGMLGSLSEASFAQVWNGDEAASIRDKRRIRRRPGCRTCQE